MRVAEVVSSVIIGAVEVVAVGILLCVGFHLGGKIIEKVESRSALKTKKKLVRKLAAA